MTSVRYAGQPAAWLEVAVTGAGDDSVYAFAVIPGSDVQGPSERDCAGAGDSTVACVITPSDLRMPDQRVVPGDGSAFVRMITVWPRERVDVVLVCVDPHTQNLGCADAVRTSLRTVDGAGALDGQPHERVSAYGASGTQLPWKPNGTRCGRWMTATGSPAKSWASRITTSLESVGRVVDVAT